jgi:light-regulated signal transduction histidine kinase (bacteriophytochrome)
VSRGSLERDHFDLGEMAQQVVDSLRQHEPERKVEVSIWPGMQVDADPRLVRAALENLIGNAWKFSSRTENASISVGVMREDGREVFHVRDNGAGFSMEYAAKLFAPFQRLHAADEFPGTGIGLATVQRIVVRHGGRIWADAKPGQGAAFYFTLGNANGGDGT